MAESARDRIIRTAHEMFYRCGFHAVGLDAILDRVGVTKTKFYNHFSSKDDLVHEVLRWHDRWWQDTFREMLRRLGGPTARGQLLAVPDALGETFECGDYNGCFFVNVAVQFPMLHDPAHQAAADHKKAMEGILRELAGFANVEDPGSLAEEIAMIMEGAYVTRQVTGHPGTAGVARRMVRLLLEQHETK
jgi:AcrR family transcriptional regulator